MTIGYQGTDWAESALANVPSPKYHFDDVWPQGVGSASDGSDKDPLEAGDHVFLAVGPKTDRTVKTLVGFTSVVVEEAEQLELRTTPNEACKAKISNVLTYDQGDPATFVTSIDVGMLVYLDDSPGLPTDVTLSFSPLNAAGDANPLAGIIHRGQSDYDDSGVGGFGASTDFPVTVADELTEVQFAVMLIK